MRHQHHRVASAPLFPTLVFRMCKGLITNSGNGAPGANQPRCLRAGRTSMANRSVNARICGVWQQPFTSTPVGGANASPTVADLMIVRHRVVTLDLEPEHLR